MKIVFDYQIFFWQRYGGISTYFSNLAKNICTLNNVVKIITPFYTNELINNNSFLDIVSCANKYLFIIVQISIISAKKIINFI